jgi:DNA-binding NtrC family response regulator
VTCVLVVDDNAMVRTAVRYMLQAAHHDVVEAADGAAAIRALGAAPIEVVVCDLFMPGLDGLQVIGEIRRLSPEVRVIAMSGGGFGGTVDLLPVARKMGAAESLRKPFTPKALLAAVERIMEPAPEVR